jgi:phosphatidylethanolamine/phosphatidyl-N-methylethanolamine N-methyltransferase
MIRESFLVEALRNPRSVGAIAPSSRALARSLTAPLRSGAGPLAVLEVGAGTGAVTRAILDSLPPASRFDIVEASPDFAQRLRRMTVSHRAAADRAAADRAAADRAASGRAASHRAVEIGVHQGRIEEFVAGTPYDVVISGLPLTNFEPGEVESIMAGLLARLRPGGTLTYFAYLGTRTARRLFASPAEARRHAAVDEIMTKNQLRYATGRQEVWLNLPPARVWRLQRPPTPPAPSP